MTAHQPLLLERRNAVAIISTSDAPINRMTLEFREQLEQGIEQFASDLVVTLFGYCLGSGLELPLESHFRLAADQVRHAGCVDRLAGNGSRCGSSLGWKRPTVFNRS